MVTLIVALAIPMSALASFGPTDHKTIVFEKVPAQFSSSSETATMEWGCPVSDLVQASSQAEAMHLIKAECMEEARRAAINRPNVLDVIQTSVIWPDIQVQATEEGFELSGTFFLETLVLQKAQP